MTIQHLLLVLILSTQTQDDPIVQFSFESLGHTYQYVITQGMLEKSPPWTKAENPPLSLKAAELIAANYVSKSFPDQKLEATLISLKRISLVDRWFYEIQMESPLLNEGAGYTYEVVILMDGTVVEPIKTK